VRVATFYGLPGNFEVKLLTMMAENELFRMRFVSPRLPGYRVDPDVLRAAQSVTARLTEAMKKQRGFGVSPEELKDMRAKTA